MMSLANLHVKPAFNEARMVLEVVISMHTWSVCFGFEIGAVPSSYLMRFLAWLEVRSRVQQYNIGLDSMLACLQIIFSTKNRVRPNIWSRYIIALSFTRIKVLTCLTV